jgi:hypothetical protein
MSVVRAIVWAAIWALILCWLTAPAPHQERGRWPLAHESRIVALEGDFGDRGKP